MKIDDPFLEVQGKLAAMEYVNKITLQVLHQLYPNANLQQAMLTMLENSVAHAKIEGSNPQSGNVLRAFVKDYGAQIINAGFGARAAGS
ncbi:hypothetical protein MKK55_28690 [Methylobacterium sp. J-059]|uniref:hypothetical protein n=1 Tax=Methylobacterium sp. J-059 TaxID=2836643 RepID=UPI001FBC0C10|nr:hypothetical protein [Methylobacterium sp. J-059]MCJ2042895.1 hypothetical protein [Methylobacterium sp. J-059]